MGTPPTKRPRGRPKKGDELYEKNYRSYDYVPDGLDYKVRVPKRVMSILKRPAEEAETGIEKSKEELGLQLVKDVKNLFLALSKELPHTGAQIATLLSERARWHILSERFTQLAVKEGIDTAKGMLYLEKALAFSKQAESSAVKSYNLSIRLAEYEAQLRKSKSNNQTPWLIVEEPEPIADDNDEATGAEGDGE